MKITETTISIAGTYRCCLIKGGLFDEPDLDLDYKVGDTKACDLCGEEFTLTEDKEWVPTWSLS